MKLNKRQYDKLNKIYNNIIIKAEDYGILPKCFNGSITDYKELVRCYNDLGNNGKVITFYSNVSNLFKLNNFNVIWEDEHKINYLITLDDINFLGRSKEEIKNICNKWTVKELKDYCKNNNYNMCINSKFKKNDYINLLIQLNTNKSYIDYCNFLDSKINI